MKFTAQSAHFALQEKMHIITQQPASWRCLHCSILTQDDGHKKLILTMLKTALNALDGFVYWLENDQVFILFQGMAKPVLEQLATIEGDMHGELDYITVDLSAEWQVFEISVNETVRTIEIQHKLNKKKRSKAGATLSRKKMKAFQDIRKKRTKPLVLIVEDDRFTAQLLGGCIGKDYNIIIASDLNKAEHLYQWKLPDMVFLDIELPDGDGQEFLKKIKSIDPKANIVMVSSHITEQHVTGCAKMGAAGFIAKPFTKDRVKHYLNSVLGLNLNLAPC